jgi:hypothetical protein
MKRLDRKLSMDSLSTLDLAVRNASGGLPLCLSPTAHSTKRYPFMRFFLRFRRVCATFLG